MKKEIAPMPTIFINEFPIHPKSPQEALAILFETTPNINCWSYPALKHLYVGCIETVTEWCVQMKEIVPRSAKTKFTKFINKSGELIHYTPRDREVLIKRIYECILSSDNLSPLRGFGISNAFGDNIKGDPERQVLRYVP